jgi:hypothetical protein
MLLKGVIRWLVPLCALAILWMIFFIAMGHIGTVLVLVAFVTLILVPNRLHKPNGSGA